MAAAKEGFPVSGARTFARLSRQIRRGLAQWAGHPHWPADVGWARLESPLYAHDWVVYAKQPPGGPDAVLDNLGRYTHRVAISNERIVGIYDDQVVFRVRAEPGGGKKRTLRLPGVAFIGRFLLHVLPAGFKRIRHYGLLSPARKRSGLAAARAALAVRAPSPALVESISDFLRRVARIEHARCPCCGRGLMRVVAVLVPLPPALHLRGPP